MDRRKFIRRLSAASGCLLFAPVAINNSNTTCSNVSSISVNELKQICDTVDYGFMSQLEMDAMLICESYRIPREELFNKVTGQTYDSKAVRIASEKHYKMIIDNE